MTQITEMTDTGYRTLHPTRGWMKVSFRRVDAQNRMAVLLDNFRPHSRKKPRLVIPSVIDTSGVIEGTVTRQQLRFAARKGLATPTVAAPAAEVKPKRARKSRAKAKPAE